MVQAGKARYRADGPVPLVQQLTRRDAQVFCEFFNQGDCRVSSATLEIADVGAMDIHLEGKLLLRQTALLPQTLEICR